MLAPEPDEERIQHHARQWVLKAENDWKNATHTLTLGESGPLDTVCFHAQQCVEKYLKALLTLHATPFARTHDIAALITLLAPHLRPSLSLREQSSLADYAVASRYPGDYEPIPLAEATAAVEMARRVRAHVRRHLPRVVLSGE